MIINHLLTGMILQVGGGGFFGVHVGKMAGCFFWCFFFRAFVEELAISELNMSQLKINSLVFWLQNGVIWWWYSMMIRSICQVVKYVALWLKNEVPLQNRFPNKVLHVFFKIMFSVFLTFDWYITLLRTWWALFVSQILFPDAHPKDEDAFHLFSCFPHWSIRQKVIIPQYIVILIRHYHSRYSRDPLFIDQNKEIKRFQK